MNKPMSQRQKMELSRAMTGNTSARNRTPVIGLGGLLASGKDTVADRLVERYSYTKIGMSDPLHEALLTLNPWIRVIDTGGALSVATPFYELIEAGISRKGESYNQTSMDSFFAKYADITAAIGYTAAKQIDDYRKALQLLGTDVARHQWNDDHWVNVADRRIKNFKRNRQPVALTGIRFENEAQMIKRNNGVLIWISRPTPDGQIAAATPSTQQHVSETSVDSSTFDIHIDNAGSLQDLFQMVDDIQPQIAAIIDQRWHSKH